MINTMIALVLTITTVVAGLAYTSERPQIHAQQTASPLTGPGRFEKTKKWKGTFHVTGSGVVQDSNGSFTLNQSAIGTFTLDLVSSTESDGLYQGNFEASVSVNDRFVPSNPGSSTSTWQGSGMSMNLAELQIDVDRCTYSVNLGGQIPVTFTTTNGGSETVLYYWGPSNGLGTAQGIRDIPLPASGRILSGRRQFADSHGDWDIVWSLECDTERDVEVAPLRQNDPAWREEAYDHSTDTIWGKGCAMTSLAMAIRFAGQPFTPSTLNTVMIALGGFNGKSVKWTQATRNSTSELMKFHALRSRSTSFIDEVLCMGFPVIVGVKLTPGGVPQHFVIVTGRQGSEFLISDPAGVYTTLSQYGSFETRGFVTEVSWNGNPNQCGGPPPLEASATVAGDRSSLTISAGNNVELLVVDPSGRRTGHDAATGDILEEIPESVYFRDSLENDQTGTQPDEVTRLVQIEHPAQGSYQITVIGVQQGAYTVTIDPYSQDGTPQTPAIVQGTAPVGSSSFQFQYSSGPTPTPTPTPTPVPTPTPLSFFQFSSSTATATETPNATTRLDLTVTRSGDTSGAASINYASSDGTANERSDYLAALGTLHFQAGETAKTISIFIVDDSLGEAAETLNVSLSNAVGVSLGVPSTITVTINSNETVDGPNPVRDASFSSEFFARQHYVDFFNREADAPGLAFWKNQIDECTTQACREIRRINVSAAFFVSIEFQQTGYLVYKANQAAFNSGEQLNLQSFLPDTQEIGRGVIFGQPGADQLLETRKQSFFLDFVQRAAFLAPTAYPTTLTAAQFVDMLNANTFDPRNPGAGALTQSQRDALVAQLAADPTSPTLRAQVLRSVSENGVFTQRQFNKAFVLMQYFGYLRRNPNAAPDTNFDGYNFWLGKLNQFNGNFVDAEMVKAFTTSSEYILRFGQ